MPLAGSARSRLPPSGGAMLRLLRALFQAGLRVALGPAPGLAAAMLALLRVRFFSRRAMGLRPPRGQGAELQAFCNFAVGAKSLCINRASN